MTDEDDKERNLSRGMSEAARWYEANVQQLVQRYESISAAKVHNWLVPFLPESSGKILDVGAGTGRDAAWLTSLGYSVVAVEPSLKLRQEAQRIHPAASIQWMDDQLPGLAEVHRLGISFDFILLSAVWMHVAPEERTSAFRKLVTLLKPGGAIALTLRHGPAEADRGIYEVTLKEVEQLAANHGAFVQRAAASPDELGRSSVSWTDVIVRRGAVPWGIEPDG
jgi:2-polyprenyl-3-methyl-5-hydroxy-6-metoxy-1,4-benzoquinol methylase